jgi:AcrR family transcriptional regulator
MTQAIQVEARKLPVQARARTTVDIILRACAQVLAEEGYARTSTNRVAAVAGVSVGSIYQYFPNKDALVLAVAAEHSRSLTELLVATAEAYRDRPIREGARHFVRGMIAAHAMDPALHRALVQQVLHLGLDQFRGSQAQVRALITAWLAVRAHEVKVQHPEEAAFVLVATVEGVIHAAVFESPELLRSVAFEEELTALVLRYLGVE